MRRNFKRQKKSGTVTLPLEIDRLSQLEKEFFSSGELPELIKQRMAMYDQLCNALPEEQKAVLINYSDINTHIEVCMIKFFYKYDLLDRATIAQLLLGKQKLKLDIHVRQEAASS